MVNARLELLNDTRAMAVLRTDVVVDLMKFVEVMVDSGWRALEITAATPGVFDAVSAARGRWGDEILIGVGTVLDASTAQRAVDCGAQLLVSPVLVEEVVQAGHSAGVSVVPGAFTPSEVLSAHASGADLVKLFPVTQMGPAYLADVRGPLGDVPLLPMGGIDSTNAQAYLDAGAFAVGVGSAAIDHRALGCGDWEAVASHARRFLQAVGVT